MRECECVFDVLCMSSLHLALGTSCHHLLFLVLLRSQYFSFFETLGKGANATAETVYVLLPLLCAFFVLVSFGASANLCVSEDFLAPFALTL